MNRDFVYNSQNMCCTTFESNICKITEVKCNNVETHTCMIYGECSIKFIESTIKIPKWVVDINHDGRSKYGHQKAVLI